MFKTKHMGTIGNLLSKLDKMRTSFNLRAAWACDDALQALCAALAVDASDDSKAAALKMACKPLWRADEVGLPRFSPAETVKSFSSAQDVRERALRALKYFMELGSFADVCVTPTFLQALSEFRKLGGGPDEDAISKDILSPPGSRTHDLTKELAKILSQRIIDGIECTWKSRIESAGLSGVVMQMSIAAPPPQPWKPDVYPSLNEKSMQDFHQLSSTMVMNLKSFILWANDTEAGKDQMAEVLLPMANLGVSGGGESIELGWLCCSPQVGQVANLYKMALDLKYPKTGFNISLLSASSTVVSAFKSSAVKMMENMKQYGPDRVRCQVLQSSMVQAADLAREGHFNALVAALNETTARLHQKIPPQLKDHVDKLKSVEKGPVPKSLREKLLKVVSDPASVNFFTAFKQWKIGLQKFKGAQQELERFVEKDDGSDSDDEVPDSEEDAQQFKKDVECMRVPFGILTPDSAHQLREAKETMGTLGGIQNLFKDVKSVDARKEAVRTAWRQFTVMKVAPNAQVAMLMRQAMED